ncbi:MAG: hypothetical protein MZU97_18955 [Bacillus subtilis]|nr:hypothetical protein [Bacillus subtilis]
MRRGRPPRPPDRPPLRTEPRDPSGQEARAVPSKPPGSAAPESHPGRDALGQVAEPAGTVPEVQPVPIQGASPAEAEKPRPLDGALPAGPARTPPRGSVEPFRTRETPRRPRCPPPLRRTGGGNREGPGDPAVRRFPPARILRGSLVSFPRSTGQARPSARKPPARFAPVGIPGRAQKPGAAVLHGYLREITAPRTGGAGNPEGRADDLLRLPSGSSEREAIRRFQLSREATSREDFPRGKNDLPKNGHGK